MLKSILNKFITALVIGGMVAFVAGCSSFSENTASQVQTVLTKEQMEEQQAREEKDHHVTNMIMLQSGITAGVIASTAIVN